MGYELLASASSGRWLTPVHGGLAVTSQTVTVGRAVLVQFTVGSARAVDAICYIVGSTAAGNVRAAILGPVTVTADSAVNAPVAVQSASVAQGTANQPQVIDLPRTSLAPGVYYAAIQGDTATGTYMRQGNQAQAPGLLQIYDRAGGYGPFTDPTPTVTDTGSAAPGLRIRLA